MLSESFKQQGEMKHNLGGFCQRVAFSMLGIEELFWQ